MYVQSIKYLDPRYRKKVHPLFMIKISGSQDFYRRRDSELHFYRVLSMRYLRRPFNLFT